MKVWKFIVLFVLSSVVANSNYAQQCGSCSKRTKFRFKLLKNHPLSVDTNRVKASGVYLYKSEDGPNNAHYFFLRFFANGRYYHSCTYCSLPSAEEMNNLSYGSYGYYRIDKNMVMVETHSGAAGYYYTYYEIKDGALILANTKSRHAKENGELESAPHLVYPFYPCVVSSPAFW